MDNRTKDIIFRSLRYMSSLNLANFATWLLYVIDSEATAWTTKAIQYEEELSGLYAKVDELEKLITGE
jgi:hypothetical protein